MGDEADALSEKFLSAMIEQFRKDAEIMEMDASYPGLVDALAAAMQPIIRAESARVLPLYRDELTKLYSANLSAAEAQQITTFLHSAAMQHFKALLAQGRTFDSSARDALQGSSISQSAMTNDIRFSALKASLKLGGDDMVQVKEFFASPLGIKLSSLNSQKLAIDQRWTNYISPDGEKEIKPAVLDTMISHIGKTDPKIARGMAKSLKRKWRPIQ
jgi:hypothetical protein